jgi:amino-acid N-acetyltransferase
MVVDIAAAAPADLPTILSLLERSKLPQAGLERLVATTLVAREGERLVGCAALELYGQAALLRSVAVEVSSRGLGLGQQLTRAALDLAKSRGIRTVYLLTETAEQFFPKFGFRSIARTAVAPAVRQSEEFTTACPESAIAMVTEL